MKSATRVAQFCLLTAFTTASLGQNPAEVQRQYQERERQRREQDREEQKRAEERRNREAADELLKRQTPQDPRGRPSQDPTTSRPASTDGPTIGEAVLGGAAIVGGLLVLDWLLSGSQARPGPSPGNPVPPPDGTVAQTYQGNKGDVYPLASGSAARMFKPSDFDVVWSPKIRSILYVFHAPIIDHKIFLGPQVRAEFRTIDNSIIIYDKTERPIDLGLRLNQTMRTKVSSVDKLVLIRTENGRPMEGFYFEFSVK